MARATKHPDPHVAGHALGAVTMLTVTKGADVLKNPDAVRCLVGHLRNRELTTRVDALRGIFTWVVFFSFCSGFSKPARRLLTPSRIAHTFWGPALVAV